jgi:hypothetical protein
MAGYELAATVEDGKSYLKAPEVGLLFGLVNYQLSGALRALPTGTVRRPGDTSFEVTVGSGLDVNVAVGEAISPSSVYGAVALHTESIKTVAVPASSTGYIFATIEDSDDNETIRTGIPKMVFSELDTNADGELLAYVETSGSAITKLIDRRVFVDNEEILALSKQFSHDPSTTLNLTFGYFGGPVHTPTGTVLTPDGEIELDDDTINYVEVDITDGLVKLGAGAGFTDGREPLYQITTADGQITAMQSARSWIGSNEGTTYTAGDGLDLTDTEFSIPANGVTDAMIGDITIDDSVVPADDTDLLGPTLSGIGNRIKAITGEDDWFDNPDTTLALAATHIADTSPHSGHFDVDGSKAMTADFNGGGFELTNLAEPTAPTSAATAAYVEAALNGTPPKRSVYAATTGNITLSGLQTIDTVAIPAGVRVLAKNQITQSQNGIYVSSAAGWTRATDADSDAEMGAGTNVFVENGHINGGTVWVMITPAVVVGTDAQEWTQNRAAGTGEINTTSNVGSGEGLAKAKSGVDLPFKSIVAGSDAVTVTGTTDEVEIDIDPAELDLSAMGGTVTPAQIAGLSGTVLGDVVYGSGAGTIARLAGNTAASKKFLTQTGNGTVSAAPGWAAIAAADVPVMVGAGVGHAAGLAPDPGSVLGAIRFLSDRGTYENPTALGVGDMLSPQVSGEVAVTTTTTLTSGAFGKMHVCTGTTADYTVTLPAPTGNAGKIIGIRMSNALTKLVTVDAGTGVAIDGQQTRVMWANEVCILLCDGTGWAKVAGKSRAMVTKIRASSAQTIPDDSTLDITEVVLDTLEFGPLMADIATSRIVARRPTALRVTGVVALDAAAEDYSRALGQVSKNGGSLASVEGYYPSGGYPTLAPTTLYQMAIGDYVDLRVYQNSGAAQDTFAQDGLFCSLTAEEIIDW